MSPPGFRAGRRKHCQLIDVTWGCASQCTETANSEVGIIAICPEGRLELETCKHYAFIAYSTSTAYYINITLL